MNSQALGGGVMLAVGAGLWALYFLPIWAKRRKFAAAQQNALRIQRTLRMLAETTELPEEVRVEATAREALAHERLLEAAGRSQLAEHEARLAEAKLAEQQAILEARANRKRADALKRELIRRSHGVRIARLVTASVAALALLGFIAGIVLAILGLGSTLLGLSVAALLLAMGALVVMAPKRTALTPAQVGQTASPVASATPESARRVGHGSAVTARASSMRSAQSTEHASRGAVRTSNRRVAQQNQQDVEQAKQLLERARLQAERVQREAIRERHDAVVAQPAASQPRVVQRAPQRPLAPSGKQSVQSTRRAVQPNLGAGVDPAALRTMGVVGDMDTQMPDLDVVLKRRRAAS